MTNVIPFQFQSLTIRTVVIDDEVWWAGKDVCAALGYTDTTNAMKQHCKGVVKRHPLSTAGGMQEIRILAEPDVMRLMINSTLPAAAPFERWVFEEVLPSIRKTGGYAIRQEPQTIIPAAKEFTALFRVARLLGLDRNVCAVSANQAMRRRTGVNLLEELGQTHLEGEVQGAWFTPTALGEMIDVSAQKLNKLMSDAGLQTNEGGMWLPTDAANGLFRWFDTGKKHGSGTSIQQLKWSRDVLARLHKEAA